MTVPSASNSITYTGNNATTAFSYSFEIPNEDAAVVTLTDISDPDVPVATVLDPSSYTITGIGDENGGTVTYPLVGSPISTTERITIQAVEDFTQESDIVNQDGFYPQVLEAALDKLTRLCQQLNERLGRAPLTPIGATEVLDIDELVTAINTAAAALASATAILTPCTATGTNAQLLTPVTGTVASYINQNLYSFVAAGTSTGAVTVNISSLGAKKAYLATGVQANTGDIVNGVYYLLVYVSALDGGSGGFYIVGTETITLARLPSQAEATILGRAAGAGAGTPTALTAAQVQTILAANLNRFPRGYLSGLTLSNNGTDATNDIDIAVGEARDSTNVIDLTLASALTKRLDAAWAVGTGNGGLDTGAIANTTYHIWLIMRSDTGVVDALFSTSMTSPTMPASYDYKRRIGTIFRSGGAIRLFTQTGDYFGFTTPPADAVTSITTARTLISLTVPPSTVARVRALIIAPGGGSAAAIFQAVAETDLAPSSGAAPGASLFTESASTASSGHFDIPASALSQIAARSSVASTSLVVVTIGFTDRRGRDS